MGQAHGAWPYVLHRKQNLMSQYVNQDTAFQSLSATWIKLVVLTQADHTEPP